MTNKYVYQYPGGATVHPYVHLDELDFNDTITLWPGGEPGEAVLKMYDAKTEVENLTFLTVFDAMKLREGLDAFISQAVGADV